jgi:hypothetical protein
VEEGRTHAVLFRHGERQALAYSESGAGESATDVPGMTINLLSSAPREAGTPSRVGKGS